MSTLRDDVITALTGPGQRFEIISAEVSGVRMRTYRHAMSSLREVLLFTEHFDDREFIVYQDVRWTYGQHLRMVAEFARYLSDGLGVVAGDRVAIAMRNFPEWSVAFWAAEAIGAVVVPLNAWWVGPELAYGIRDSGSCVLIVDSERLIRLQPLLDSLDLRKVIVVRGNDGEAPDGVDSWEQVCTGLDEDSNLPTARIGPDDPSTIVYTSGTTGKPKGALHLHRNHCTSVMNNLLFAEVGRVIAEAAGGDAPPPAAARQPASLLTFPFFHIAGLVNLYLPLSSGSKLVLMHRWDVDEAVRLIIEEGVSTTAVVPTVLRDLLNSDRLLDAGGATLTSLAAGGAAVPASLIRRMGTQFGGRMAPANGYGLTETTAGVIGTSGADYLAHPESIGRPFPVVDVRIVDGDGLASEVGEVGELWVRGPNVVPGYWNNPAATAEAFTDGWFHTGDLARRDDDGWFYIADRLKDVVIRGGENVYCAEVEAALLEHPDVDDVAVIGMPHESLGEEVVAVVRLVPPSVLDEPTLIAFAKECLAYYKVPARVVVWPTELPRTPTGKVLKRTLREELLLAKG